MKKTSLFLISAFLLSLGVQAGVKDLTPGTYAYISVENPSDFARKNVPVTLKISDITAQIEKYKGEDIGIFDGSKEVFSQYDDMDKDGKPDEVSFLVNLKAKGTVKLLVRALPQNFKRPNFEKEVYAEMVKRVKIDNRETHEMVTEESSNKDDMYNQMYHHGVAFETDLIAYRLYFDKRQTVDVYGKVKPQLELSQTQWYPTEDQLAQGFGDDVLFVANSVGVGTFRGWDGEKAIPFDQISKRTQRIVATGSLRNVVEIEVAGWKYQGKSIHAKIRYIQYARHRDCEVQVLFDPDFSEDLTFATGVQKMPEEKYYTDKAGLVGIWGSGMPMSEPEKAKYGKQTVGLGVAVPAQYTKQQAEDKENHLVLIGNSGQSAITYYLTAAALKEKKGFKTADSFFKYLESWKNEVTNPVKVTLSAK